MLWRSALVALVLVSVSWFARQQPPDASPLARPLSALPRVVGGWSGRDVPLDAETLRALGMDDYLHRVYVPEGAATGPPIDVYVAYYASQRQGDAIHSPLNCLPGTGWQPVTRERVRVATGASAGFSANRLVVQKGRERKGVLYWYEGRGRRIASEYMNKLLLIVDGIRENRTDAALVRFTTPVETTIEEAGARLAEFAAIVDPALVRALSPAAEAER
jgi:EpsI family protein